MKKIINALLTCVALTSLAPAAFAQSTNYLTRSNTQSLPYGAHNCETAPEASFPGERGWHLDTTYLDAATQAAIQASIDAGTAYVAVDLGLIGGGQDVEVHAELGMSGPSPAVLPITIATPNQWFGFTLPVQPETLLEEVILAVQGEGIIECANEDGGGTVMVVERRARLVW